MTVAGAVVGGERGLHGGDDADTAFDGADSLRRFAETPPSRDLRRVDDAEHHIDPFVTEVGYRDDGSDISELRSEKDSRPRHQIGEVGHQFVQLLLRNVMDRRRDKTAAAQRYPDTDMNPRRGLEPVFPPESVELAEPLRGDCRPPSTTRRPAVPVRRWTAAHLLVVSQASDFSNMTSSAR